MSFWMANTHGLGRGVTRPTRPNSVHLSLLAFSIGVDEFRRTWGVGLDLRPPRFYAARSASRCDQTVFKQPEERKEICRPVQSPIFLCFFLPIFFWYFLVFVWFSLFYFYLFFGFLFFLFFLYWWGGCVFCGGVWLVFVVSGRVL